MPARNHPRLNPLARGTRRLSENRLPSVALASGGTRADLRPWTKRTTPLSLCRIAAAVAELISSLQRTPDEEHRTKSWTGISWTTG